LVFESFRRVKNGERAAVADANATSPAVERPMIGLALGGGAARGFAHIGVIRTLCAHGINPNIIVGTSIGAVVGGCYARDQLDSFEQWSLSLTRRGILGYLDVSLSAGGLIGGGRLASRLEATLGDTQIEQLPLRFATIATEVGTGHEIWLTRGRLVDALRASYALPGIFPPVWLGGRWLVDGALVNPVPVSTARVLGARLVIAVNLNSDILGRGATIMDHGTDPVEGDPQAPASDPAAPGTVAAERALKRQFFSGAKRPGLPTVMVDAFNIMQDRITRARLAGDPPDVMINPHMGGLGWFDFHRAQEAIELGARATERALEQIDEAIVALSPRTEP
jgi:NTE family protein